MKKISEMLKVGEIIWPIQVPGPTGAWLIPCCVCGSTEKISRFNGTSLCATHCRQAAEKLVWGFAEIARAVERGYDGPRMKVRMEELAGRLVEALVAAS